MGRTIRLFTTQNLEQKMEPCSEEKCHLPRYIKLVLKWGDSDVGEGVEIFFHQPPSILASDWSASPHLLVCKTQQCLSLVSSSSSSSLCAHAHTARCYHQKTCMYCIHVLCTL